MDTQPNGAVANDANNPVDATANPADYFTQMAADEFGVNDDDHDDDQNRPPADDGNNPDDQLNADDLDDDPDGKAGDDDLPPIDAPVSWDAEAKAKFAELPRDAQEVIAKRETERERFVQSKSQEAARAKQEAEQAATQQVAAYEAHVAQQLSQYAEQIAPQRPNPALLQHDPQAFYAMQADYEAKVAQQRELQQQSQQYAQQAQARAMQIAQAEQAEQHRIIVDSFPEYADPTTGPELQRKLTAVAKELGYPDELIGQARATDILAIRAAADWKAKADKYDGLMAKQMEKVRSAKGKPPVQARPGVSQGSDQARSRNVSALKETLLTSKNRDVQGAAFMELAQKNGWVS